MTSRRMNVKSVADLEAVLQYKFNKPELLRQALTQKSAINEKHPEASNRDLLPLAFIGDAVLKYTSARYLLLNGKQDVIENCVKLHQGAQTVILNRFLAGIAQHKLHLEEYLIRGNTHVTPSEKMFADCMEAIFGAIALDCGIDQQEIIFRMIAKLCFQPIEELLVDTLQARLASSNREEEDERILKDIIRRCRHEIAEGLASSGIEATSSLRKKTACNGAVKLAYGSSLCLDLSCFVAQSSAGSSYSRKRNAERLSGSFKQSVLLHGTRSE